jgi:hypothetical protein
METPTTNENQPNSILVAFGSIFFLVNLLLLVLLIFFRKLERMEFMATIIILLIEVSATIIGCYWYSQSEKAKQGTIIPLLVIIISMFLTFQMWMRLDNVKNPYSNKSSVEMPEFY